MKDISAGAEMKVMVVVLSEKQLVTYIVLIPGWFAKVIEAVRKSIYNCFVAEVSSNHRETTFLKREMSNLSNILEKRKIRLIAFTIICSV